MVANVSNGSNRAVEEVLPEEFAASAVIHKEEGWFAERFLEISNAQTKSVPPLEPRRVVYIKELLAEGFVFSSGCQLTLDSRGWSSFVLDLRDASGEVIASLKRESSGDFTCFNADQNLIGELKFSQDKKSASFVANSGETLAEMELEGERWNIRWRAKEPLNQALIDALVVVAENETPGLVAGLCPISSEIWGIVVNRVAIGVAAAAALIISVAFIR